MNAMTWEDILADRSLRDLPYKIETNRASSLCPDFPKQIEVD